MSAEEKEKAREQVTQLRDNMEDYPVLYTDYETTRQLGQLYLNLNKD